MPFGTHLGIGTAAIWPVEAKTAAYTIDVEKDPSGKVFTTRGAGATVTFTLPAASGNAGVHYYFFSVANQDLVVAGADEEVVSLNDLTADNVQFTTTSELIGGGFLAVCDGTSWIIVALLATEAQTVTVTSA